MALPLAGAGAQVGDGRISETLTVGASTQPIIVGGSTSTTLGFHGVAGAVQAAVVTAVSTTSPILSSSGPCYGFETSTQPAALIAAVNSILTLLKNKGLMSSS